MDLPSRRGRAPVSTARGIRSAVCARHRGIAGILLSLSALLTGACAAAAPAVAGTLESVREAGVVRCGAVARPGLAQASGAGQWTGMLVDLCRAVAAAALGTLSRIEFHAYGSDADFDRVRRGRDDVYFLTGGEINAHALAGFVNPGPTVFVAHIAVMVPADAPERHPAELAGQGICFRIAEPAERSLEDYFDSRQLPWLRHPFSEDGEMMDAFAVRRCHAVAGEATWLAGQRRAAGRAPARVLSEALESFPLVAATGTDDGRWSAIVAWTMDTVVNAERSRTRWFAGGTDALPLPAGELGLAPGWQAAVIAAVGNYGTIIARHLGPASPLGLERREIDTPLVPFVE